MTEQALQAVPARAPSIDQRVAALAWRDIEAALDQDGAAILSGILDASECTALAADFANEALFRSRIVMARHNFGRGEYKYFAAPLPALVAELRTTLYPPLAAIAEKWSELLGEPQRYPARHADFLALCHAKGQAKPTPLLLQYAAGDFNCLHQDLYGECFFPLQVAFLLSQPGEDFTGGEFLLVESRPRAQSRPQVIPLRRGDAVVFAVHDRPVRGVRGFYRVTLRHGVSRVLAGHRSVLGVIFHDAR
ncbi:MAG: 2OG-Fe(II) oxygenase [Acetobacteraceae bacterium]